MEIMMLLDGLVKFWVEQFKYFSSALQIGEVRMPLPAAHLQLSIYSAFNLFHNRSKCGRLQHEREMCVYPKA